MVRVENNSITYLLNSDGRCIPLQCGFLESGYYTVPKQKTYRHPHPPFNRLFLFRSGGGYIWTDEEKRLEPGVFYLLPKNQTFRASYLPESEFLYIHFVLEDQYSHDVFQTITPVLQTAGQRGMFDVIFEGYLSQDDLGPLRWQPLVFSVLMDLVAPLLEDVSLQSYKSSKYGRMLEWIKEHCTASLRVEDLAAEFNVSRTVLSRSFSHDFGVSLKEYMLQLLMQRARRLLIASDMSIAEIAYSLGYEDPEYFSRIFKAKMHETPTTYRSQMRSSRVH
jgi:AraC-like DNA-binding protein